MRVNNYKYEKLSITHNICLVPVSQRYVVCHKGYA